MTQAHQYRALGHEDRRITWLELKSYRFALAFNRCFRGPSVSHDQSCFFFMCCWNRDLRSSFIHFITTAVICEVPVQRISIIPFTLFPPCKQENQSPNPQNHPPYFPLRLQFRIQFRRHFPIALPIHRRLTHRPRDIRTRNRPRNRPTLASNRVCGRWAEGVAKGWARGESWEGGWGERWGKLGEGG